MNHTQEKALFQLTGKLKIAKLPAGSLQQMAEETPYFAPARFFALAENKQRLAPEYWQNEAARTALYFTNPYWLHYQLTTLGSVAEPVGSITNPAEQATKAESYAIPTVEAVREMMRKIDPSQETTGDVDDTDAPPAEEDGETDSKIAGILSHQLADFKKPVEADAVLEIEVEKKKLHTIDYFASQGIKIDLSSIPQDKLTTHLRKFTDWLKQIKKTNTEPADLGTNLEMEKAVVENAAISNESREILTEAMADVLEKQGQTEKAIQLYIKLSFLNPEKSSYFAAKIEQLKGI
jgi:hypothetical protein